MANVRKKQIEQPHGEEVETEISDVAAPGIAIDGAEPIADEAAAQQSQTAEAGTAAEAAEPKATASVEPETSSPAPEEGTAASTPAAESTRTAETAEVPKAAEPEADASSTAEPAPAAEAAAAGSDASTADADKKSGKKDKVEEDPIEKAKKNYEELQEKSDAAKKELDDAIKQGVSKRKVQKLRTKYNNAAAAMVDAKHDYEVEIQRAKNKVYFAQAQSLASAEDEDLEEIESQIEDIDFEDEFLSDEQLQAKRATQIAAKPKGKFTTQANNITGDVDTFITLQSKQREFFETRACLRRKWRKAAMDRLHSLINKYETPLIEAIHRDFGITRYEAYMTELAPIHAEFKILRKCIEDFAVPSLKGKRMWTLWPTRFKRTWMPYGTVLIINSWESPVGNMIIMLAEALLAGNTVVVKNSGRTKRCNEVLASAFNELFKPDYVKFVYGGTDLDEALLAAKFDKIAYCGPRENSLRVQEANLHSNAPVTLQLDGNNACYVDVTADLKVAAERIMMGKMIKSGQTRLAPHYVFVSESVHKNFVNRTFAYVERVYGKDPIHSKGYPRMFSRKEYDEACDILDHLNSKAKIIYGGERDPKTLRIAPTVILCDSVDNPIFKRDIVGPILVVGISKNADEAFSKINSLPTPPALYLFTTHKKTKKFAMLNVQYGQMCINDCMTQVMDRKNPHPATGTSGNGSIGGMRGLEEFGTYRVVAINGKHDPVQGWRKTPYPLEGYKKIKRKYKFFNM